MASEESNNTDSEPRCKSSTLLPKPDLTLPNLGDIVPFQAGGPQFQLPPQAASIPSLFVPGVSEILIDGRPVAQYEICGKVFTMQKGDKENFNSWSRETVGGRNLTYTLTVIQEPARARACGAGPRASADRRPVDPPPVVQLTIVDNKLDGTKEDITMLYDAGFMLYASLEISRPIAHGRMHTATQPPVLTGVAVASTAYLEKPERAGYFIFPDLSVRHEGWYRLKFSLFEAVKHPEDADSNRPFVDQSASDANQNVVSHQSMANRMEVQSFPFQVFSAKKFPGLSASTDVSRSLAEQGCRVRIRREIRQRKRVTDEKPDDGHSSRPSPAPSFSHPEPHRSASRSSMEYYDRMRQPSIDYARPTPSRQPSIASLTHPSPSSMAPPPMIKYDSSPVYSPIQRDTRPPQTDLYAPQRHTLPPLSSMQPPVPHVALSQPLYNPSTRQYQIAAKPMAKRSHSSDYNEHSALKSGDRPDRPVLPQPLDANNIIVADDRDDPDDEQLEMSLSLSPYLYDRADGSKSKKTPRDWNYHSGRRY